MYVQIVTFTGPRSVELIAASERAARERLEPAVAAHPTLREELVAGFRATSADGHEIIVQLARTAETFDTLREVVMSSQLLPGEDPTLLPGPDRVETYEVTDTYGALAAQPTLATQPTQTARPEERTQAAGSADVAESAQVQR
jgi:hypothetical protein